MKFALVSSALFFLLIHEVISAEDRFYCLNLLNNDINVCRVESPGELEVFDTSKGYIDSGSNPFPSVIHKDEGILFQASGEDRASGPKLTFEINGDKVNLELLQLERCILTYPTFWIECDMDRV
jgi:hypothetical protein